MEEKEIAVPLAIPITAQEKEWYGTSMGKSHEVTIVAFVYRFSIAYDPFAAVLANGRVARYISLFDFKVKGK